MPLADWLTKATVWLALAGYAAGAGLLLRARGRDGWLRRAHLAWTAGCAFFLAHVASAFGFFHHWSHAEAYRETARQTEVLTGWRWGGGLYFNYLFAAGWLADVLWWWWAPVPWEHRARWLTLGWQAFLYFMVFNGTIVFGRGPVRWYGAAICAVLAGLWSWPFGQAHRR